MFKTFPVFSTLISGLLTLLLPSALHADGDVPFIEAEGLITECEILWREELPIYHNVEFENGYPGIFSNWGAAQYPGTAVVVDSEGAIYFVCCVTMEQAGKPNPSVVLVKYSSDGERLWAQQFDEEYGDSPIDVELDSHGNVYIAGNTQYRIGPNGTDAILRHRGFVASYTSAGRHRWTYIEEGRSPETTSYYLDMAVHEESIYVVGRVRGSVERRVARDSSRRDMLVTRIRVDGRHLWSRQFQGHEEDCILFAAGVEVASNGSVFVAGNYWGDAPEPSRDVSMGAYGMVLQLDANGDERMRFPVGEVPIAEGKTYLDYASELRDIELDDDGNLYLLGTSRHPFPNGARDDIENFHHELFVAKYTADGRLLWNRQPQTPWRLRYPQQLHYSPEGRVWVVGYAITDVLVIEYDAEDRFMNALRHIPRPSQPQGSFRGESLVFDATQRTLIVAGRGYPTRSAAPRDRHGNVHAQPAGQQRPSDRLPPRSFVMRIPLLENLSGTQSDVESPD